MKNLLPKKLWLLRAYVVILIGFAEVILTLYVGFSIVNSISGQSILGDVIMGIAGLYLVILSLGILLSSQIILLFIGIHDNVDDMRKKALDENYKVNLIQEKEKDSLSTFNSFFTIALIVLSILFSTLNLSGVTGVSNVEKAAREAARLDSISAVQQENMRMTPQEEAAADEEAATTVTDDNAVEAPVDYSGSEPEVKH